MPKSVSVTEKNGVKKRPAAVAGAETRGTHEHGTNLLTAFQEIRELIVHGKMSPGMWIVEADLSERLSMSRTPVRAAIHWLQREGYVLEQRNGKKSRMIVAPLTKEDANELYLMIGRLEGIAGRGAAQMPGRDREQLAKQLKILNDRLLRIADGHDNNHTASIFDLDRNFHRMIVHAASGPRLLTLHGAIEPQAERYWRLYASSIIKDLHRSVDEHTEILQALLAGDPDGVERGLQSNWSHGAERLGHVIDIFGERGSW